jgi:hypothetical protein
MTILPLETEKLDRLRAAILKWQVISAEEFEHFRQRSEGQPAPPMADYGYDPVGDEAFMLGQTERVMWASFAVAIASAVERLFGSICDSLELPLPAKPNWGHKKGAIEKKLGIDLASVDGFSGATLARLLGNDFKHNSGTVSPEHSSYSGRQIGVEIEYEKEQWQAILGNAKSFMCALADRLDGLPTPLPEGGA